MEEQRWGVGKVQQRLKRMKKHGRRRPEKDSLRLGKRGLCPNHQASGPPTPGIETKKEVRA